MKKKLLIIILPVILVLLVGGVVLAATSVSLPSTGTLVVADSAGISFTATEATLDWTGGPVVKNVPVELTSTLNVTNDGVDPITAFDATSAPIAIGGGTFSLSIDSLGSPLEPGASVEITVRMAGTPTTAGIYDLSVVPSITITAS